MRPPQSVAQLRPPITSFQLEEREEEEKRAWEAEREQQEERERAMEVAQQEMVAAYNLEQQGQLAQAEAQVQGRVQARAGVMPRSRSAVAFTAPGLHMPRSPSREVSNAPSHIHNRSRVACPRLHS